jgi:chemosensory pili system protein ChpA (sensor histidine kinase/response regulator)
MVVDDSLTVRKVAGRLLEREGYQVLMAKDGVDALDQMKNILPDVMLVDIEMPRMDGFELAQNLRGDSRTQDIPIVIISSRIAEKHRTRAEQLGVNAVLGKPFQETALLQHLEALLPSSKAGARYH